MNMNRRRFMRGFFQGLGGWSWSKRPYRWLLSPAVGALAACHANQNVTDVVVVGGGGAGLAAAVSAAEQGLKVVLCEKESTLGGNTAISTGLFAAVDPIRQRKQGIQDSEELFARQMLSSGRGKSDPALVRRLAREAFPTLCWLESLGLRFEDTLIETYGSHWVRDHRPLTANGRGYIQVLGTQALRLGVELRTDVFVHSLLRTGNEPVAGIRGTCAGKPFELLARYGVILASGGFGANNEMIAQYAPQLADLTTDNAPGNTGEMIREAQRIGAALRDMGEIQCLPGCPRGRTHRVRLHTDVSRFVMVDHYGRRFIREDGRRDDLRDAVLSLPERYAYSIVDNRGLQSHNILVQKETVVGVETGDAWRADTLEELAAQLHLPAQELIQSIRLYNRAVDTKSDPFGRAPMNLIHKIDTPPFWACLAGMTVHSTMGGIAIDENARVLDQNGHPVPQLFAAGETTGGVHGANRLGAHGIPDAITFGRIAGLNVGGPVPKKNRSDGT